MANSERIETIAAQLRAADVAYFNSGEAIMEDAAYDALKDELKRLAPNHELLKVVGAKPSGMLTKVAHSIPMGSQNKAKNRSEFDAWVRTLPPGSVLVASLKLDGGSMSETFDAGTLALAATRGDGLIGEDITDNARQFSECPKSKVAIMGHSFSGYVRFEVMLNNENWLTADPDQTSNPRNLSNGIARRKDGEQAELLTPIAFRAYNKNGIEIADTEIEMLQHLEESGFKVSPWKAGSPDEIWRFIEETIANRAKLPFWIDGVVVKHNDIRVQRVLGESNQCPRGQIAVKFPPEVKESVLRSVELTVGHTGAIIPTAKFDPVQLGGTTVSNALLCNWDLIRSLGVAVGDSIRIYKAGDIIPKILEVVSRPANRVLIDEPTKCPVCGGPVGRKQSVHGEESVMLYCLNDDCPAKAIGKIDRYIRSLNILGIGDEVLIALTRGEDGALPGVGPLLQSPADLYALKNNADALGSLCVGAKSIRLGEKRAKKIIDEIEAKREITLAELIGSLGIEGLGKRRVTLIQGAVPGCLDTVEDWIAGKLASLAVAAGVPNIGKQLSDAVVAKAPLIRQFLANGVVIKSAVPKTAPKAGSLSFCITGTLAQPRDFYLKLIEERGHQFRDSVAKGLDYLVMADPTSASSKAEKARKLGTKCIGADELLRILG